MQTGAANNNGGYVDVFVDEGGGFEAATTLGQFYDDGELVFAKCSNPVDTAAIEMLETELGAMEREFGVAKAAIAELEAKNAAMAAATGHQTQQAANTTINILLNLENWNDYVR